ncbi:MAG: hypothetical protein IPL06_09905 [Betaproteobacteria bacterium]|nr:hypothetical protein [Betaproteobacteria bacterium]
MNADVTPMNADEGDSIRLPWPFGCTFHQVDTPCKGRSEAAKGESGSCNSLQSSAFIGVTSAFIGVSKDFGIHEH